MNEFLPWLLISLLGLGAGVFTLYYLAAPPLRMSLYLALALSAGFAAAALVAQSFTEWLLPGGLALVCFVIGYISAVALFLAQRETHHLPVLTRQPGEAGQGHTAVIYFTHGEPQAYSPLPWLETFHELDADRVPSVPWMFRPLFFYNLRKYYLEIGGSLHNAVHESMLHSLQASWLQADHAGIRFYLAFLDNSPRPDEVAIRALNDGASRIILAAVFLTDSSHTHLGYEMVQALEPARYGVSLAMTAPLWDAEALQRVYVERARQHLGETQPSRAGVILVGHGQPPAWDQIYGTQTEQEILFRQQVKQRFVLDGYLAENIQLAWMEFKAPRIREAVQALIKNGVEKLFVAPASISASAIHSEIEIPHLVQQAGIPDEVAVIHLGAWGNDPLVIEAIRLKIQACLEGNDR